MKKPKQIHEALQAIDDINDFIQVWRYWYGERKIDDKPPTTPSSNSRYH